jgi:hypothetical protein
VATVLVAATAGAAFVGEAKSSNHVSAPRKKNESVFVENVFANRLSS